MENVKIRYKDLNYLRACLGLYYPPNIDASIIALTDYRINSIRSMLQNPGCILSFACKRRIYPGCDPVKVFEKLKTVILATHITIVEDVHIRLRMNFVTNCIYILKSDINECRVQMAPPKHRHYKKVLVPINYLWTDGQRGGPRIKFRK